ncbi:DUF6157 family protein [Paenibacillus hexagrammi]|uniref:DUF6157 family protein n=1 Tax=Paenibacillus hexagrammi TaxID=2908839 RepID=A0ABY3SQT8_9BACL|nr:DUF6157 family protein [Paenibacillus sp. YPD9-1]UJF35833.1 DUF6157 family protein [Paenibacillus sp. YPD9-1]
MGSYTNTFILIAPDCPAEYGQVPVAKKDAKPIHVIQYELLSQHPYEFTQDELIFQTHIRHKLIPEAEIDSRKEEIWSELFSKPHPCLRASTLAKRYGWGFHYNQEGKIAVYPMESEPYINYAGNTDGTTSVIHAMRNAKAK